MSETFTCGGCMHWKDPTDGQGVCRRFPPGVGAGVIILHMDSPVCGEYEDREFAEWRSRKYAELLTAQAEALRALFACTHWVSKATPGQVAYRHDLECGSAKAMCEAEGRIWDAHTEEGE